MSLRKRDSYQIGYGLEFISDNTDQGRNFQFDQGEYLPANKSSVGMLLD